jgi:hypothetical protein
MGWLYSHSEDKWQGIKYLGTEEEWWGKKKKNK